MKGMDFNMKNLNILVSSSRKNHMVAEKLRASISKWATVENWCEKFGNRENTSLLTFEEGLADVDQSLFVLVQDDIDMINDVVAGILEYDLIFDILISFSYIGKRNTVIVVPEGKKAILDLIKATAFLEHDFSNSIDSLAEKYQDHCKNSALPINSRKVREFVQIARSDIKKAAIRDDIFDW